MSDTTWLLIVFALGAASIGAAGAIYVWVKKQKPGSDRAQEIGGFIRRSARTYLRKLYLSLAVVAAAAALVLAAALGIDWPRLAAGEGLFFDASRGIGVPTAFVVGALFAAVAGYMGMSIAVHANVRTAAAALRGLVPAFRISFYAGSVMGLAMTGIAVVGMTAIYLITRNVTTVLGFSFGASAMALLAKAGGGIFTKTADISADLVGKVEMGIPEDDPRNPAVIADNVGDNVGDIAGMGADIYDSYVASVVASMLLGVSLVGAGHGERYIILPLILSGAGILASLIGVQLVRVKEGGRPGPAMNRGTALTCVLFAGLAAALSFGLGFGAAVFVPAVTGLVAGVLIGLTTDYFTSNRYRPVKRVADVSRTGTAVNIITGFSYGLISMIPSLLGIVAATLVSYYWAQGFGLSGLYGVGIAAVGMLSTTGMIVSGDAFGPIVDNAKGVAEMANLREEAVDIADVLDSAGNTTAAITKGFSIGAAALTVLALFSAYGEEIGSAGFQLQISLRNPLVLAGVFIGALAPPVFSALTMLSVTKNAYTMIEEIRRQFKKHPDIMKGGRKPDYDACVDIAARDALRSLILRAVIAVLLPLAVGFVLGPDALGGFLGGSIFTGVIFALFMANSGGLWDNAKKYIEANHFGGSGSEAHKSSVVGDTVGDPFKDTAGPSLNTLITVMSLVSSLFAPLIAVLHVFS